MSKNNPADNESVDHTRRRRIVASSVENDTRVIKTGCYSSDTRLAVDSNDRAMGIVDGIRTQVCFLGLLFSFSFLFDIREIKRNSRASGDQGNDSEFRVNLAVNRMGLTMPFQAESAPAA